MMDTDGEIMGCCQECLDRSSVVWWRYLADLTHKHIHTSDEHFPQPIDPINTFKNLSLIVRQHVNLVRGQTNPMMDDDHDRKSLCWPLMDDDHDGKSLCWTLMGDDHATECLCWVMISCPQADDPSPIVMTS